MSNDKKIQTRVRFLRGLFHISQAELSRQTGLTPAAISQIEDGSRLPSVKTLVRLSNYFKCSVDHIIMNDDFSGSKERIDFSIVFGKYLRLTRVNKKKVLEYLDMVNKQQEWTHK